MSYSYFLVSCSNVDTFTVLNFFFPFLDLRLILNFGGLFRLLFELLRDRESFFRPDVLLLGFLLTYFSLISLFFLSIGSKLRSLMELMLIDYVSSFSFFSSFDSNFLPLPFPLELGIGCQMTFLAIGSIFIWSSV